LSVVVSIEPLDDTTDDVFERHGTDAAEANRSGVTVNAEPFVVRVHEVLGSDDVNATSCERFREAFVVPELAFA
jgi:hypothetical protein